MPAQLDPLNAITLLGILEQGPRSGYDVKRFVDEQLEHVIDITAGTVYYMLKRFEERGWTRGSVSRNGRRPQRRTYRLTPAGRRAFRALLEHAAFQSDRFFPPFDIALYFIPYLRPETAVRAVDKRLDDIARTREAFRRLEERFPVRWPFHLYYLREKAKEIADCNERWCVRLRRKIREKHSRKA
jgi:DNA-binding PadR family transcriptional regulator